MFKIMHGKYKFLACFLLAVTIFTGCASKKINNSDPLIYQVLPNAVPPYSTIVSLETISNRTWQLSEIIIGEGQTTLNRAKMSDAGKGGYFVLQFTPEGINGRAAPNTYFAPYAAHEGKSISLRPITGTLHATEINIGGLMESEYYWYLQRINRWELSGNVLELFLTPVAGQNIVMRYTMP
ncbi:hypothetical protein AGMMS50212_01710 [Spirochaetia bacterium]|nr:hypothetical protein AGMMS50212_01710 [Spirochaetia bacterium]